MKRLIVLGFAALSLVGCGAINATESVPDKMDAMKTEVAKTNDGMAKTNGAIHNQTLAVALAEMMKPENTEYFSPAPLGMMPAGQVFANEATADDLIKIVYVELMDIDQSQPDDSLKDPATGTWTPALVKTVDHQKTAKLMAAMVIAGLAPQATIDQIIEQQINQGGRYEQTAYAVLMLRYAFVRDILLAGSLFEHPMTNPGELTEAANRADELESISSLPYVGKIKLKTNGMLSGDDNADLTLDPADTLSAWKKIDGAFDTDLDPKYRQNKGSFSTELMALRARVKAHLPASAN
jgi:hypothetical protein